MEDVFAQYYEDLLRAQYQVSENLIKKQHLSCGTIREDFLREILLKKNDSVKITKGFVGQGSGISGECDLIFYNGPSDTLGGQIFVKPEHCKLVLEVKSNATGADIIKTNINFEKIKAIDAENQLFCGLFCYNITLLKSTVLNRFGWAYDRDTDSWWEDVGLRLIYPNIDFIVCIACLEEDEERTAKQFFLEKDNIRNNYILQQDYPIIKNFFKVTDNL